MDATYADNRRGIMSERLSPAESLSERPLPPQGHVSVLQEASIRLLAPAPGTLLLDGTFGGGGHTRALLDASAPDGRVLALDADPDAIARMRKWANQSREPALEYLPREVGYTYRMRNVRAGIGRGQLPVLAHAAVVLLDAAADDLTGVLQKDRVGLGKDAPDHRIEQLNRPVEHRHPIHPRHRPLVPTRHKIRQMPHQVFVAHHSRMTHSAGSAGLFVPCLPR